MGGRILVVDDDPMIVSVVSDILELEGYEVAQAANGAEALEILEDNPPAAVLLDLQMPVLDGRGFAQALWDRRLDVPIVLMTAAYDSRRWCDEVRAIGCLAKPFEIPDLLGALEQAAA